jgi:hypothetical protein
MQTGKQCKQINTDAKTTLKNRRHNKNIGKKTMTTKSSLFVQAGLLFVINSLSVCVFAVFPEPVADLTLQNLCP